MKCMAMGVTKVSPSLVAHIPPSSYHGGFVLAGCGRAEVEARPEAGTAGFSCSGLQCRGDKQRHSLLRALHPVCTGHTAALPTTHTFYTNNSHF